MCKVKATRVDKNVPEWVQKEWRTGDKNALADLFVQTNFQKEHYPFHVIATSLMLSVFYLASLFFMLGQEDFLNRLQTIVRKRQSIKLTIDEGFYSESEMKEELGWGQQDPQVYFPSALPAPTIAQMHAHTPSTHVAWACFSSGLHDNILIMAPRKKIDGAKARCLALGKEFYRICAYLMRSLSNINHGYLLLLLSFDIIHMQLQQNYIPI